MAARTVRVPSELADWWRAHCVATGRTVSDVAVEALSAVRERHPSPATSVTPPLVEPRRRGAPVQGRDRRLVDIPSDLHHWLRLYCAMTGKTGDAVIAEALTEYRARVERREPCGQGSA